MQSKNLSAPDERRTFDKGKLELVTLGGVTFGRATLLPGWKWSTSLQALMKTKSCEAPHLQYHVSGRLAVLMDTAAVDVDYPIFLNARARVEFGFGAKVVVGRGIADFDD